MKNRNTKQIVNHPIFTGVSIMILLSVILTAAASALVLGNVIPQDAMQTAGIVCAAAAALIGSTVTAKKTNTGKMVYSLCAGAIYAAVLFLCNLLFAKDGDLNILRILLPILACAVIGCLLAASAKNKSSKRRNAGIYAFSKGG